MAGLKIVLPTSFTDTSLPVVLPSLGISTLPTARYAARSLLGASAGAAVASWPEANGGSALTPTKQSFTPTATPANYRLDGASGEPYVEIHPNITVTFTASSDLVTFASAHNRSVGDAIAFTSLSGVAGITAGTIYYVKTVPSSTTMTLAPTAGGVTLDITADGTGNSAQALANTNSDLTGAQMKTIAFIFRRASGSGIMWSGSTILYSGGASPNLIVSGNTGSIPTAATAYGQWHLVVVRIDGNNSRLTVDGTTAAQALASVSSSLAATHIALGAESSTYNATAPVQFVEVVSFGSVLSDSDVATLRTSLKAAYPGLALP